MRAANEQDPDPVPPAGVQVQWGQFDILHQVAIRYTPLCTVPPHIFASNIGASMRRTKHHSKVTSSSHFQMLFITTSCSCPNQKFYRNVQKATTLRMARLPGQHFSESRIYMTNLNMVSWHQRTRISLNRNEPPKRIPQATLPKWTFHLVKDVYPQWTL